MSCHVLPSALHPKRVKLPVVATLLIMLAPAGCSGPGSIPSADDVPRLFAEAAGESSPPLFDSKARRTTRNCIAQLLEGEKQYVEEAARLFGRPNLSSYFLTDDSFIGRTFPRETANLLREVESLQADYFLLHESFPMTLDAALERAGVPEGGRQAAVESLATAVASRQGPALEVTRIHGHFVAKAAELYELAADNELSIQSKREGLEISDDWLHGRFNELVDEVNTARDAALDAVARLDPRQHASQGGLGLERRR